MTIFRSRIFDVIGKTLLAVGVAGFSITWLILWNSQFHVLGRDQLKVPSADRPAPIEMKGVTWYVEPAFARRYKLADDLIFPFWVIGVLGGCIVARAKIATWFRTTGGKSGYP